MTDRQKAFAAMEVYREIMYSDAEPQAMVEGLQVLADALESLELDENVWVMVQGMFDQTRMRIELIGSAEEQRAAAKAAEMHDKIINSVSYLHRWSKQFLQTMRERLDVVDYDSIRASIARRAERNAWYEDSPRG